ncbi:MAG: ornithine cyclodeaminase family protein [Acidimicrobiales bacterium]
MHALTYLDAEELRERLPMATAIEAMRLAYGDDREVPQRLALGVSLFMPGRAGSHTGIKVVSTVPGNPVGLVAVFGPDGSPLGVVDGTTLTAIRTGAGAGLATALLARPDARTLAMLGAGAMASDQVDAVCSVRPIDRVLVWSRTRARAEALADRLASSAAAGRLGAAAGGQPPGAGAATRIRAEVADSPDAAVAEADVVTTATPATSPLFAASAARPTVHVNAVGAYTPAMAELPPGLLHASWVVVEDRAAAAQEAGDLLQAGRSPDAEMGDLLAGRVTPPPDTPTVFKSVGIASMDVAAAVAALSPPT